MLRRYSRAAALVFGFTIAAEARAVDLVSHRAVYHLHMADVDPSSGIRNVEGALEIHWRRGCAGWLTDQRLAFAGDVGGESPFTYAVDFKTEESFDETELAFDVAIFDGGVLVSSSKGKAVIDQPGGAGSAVFTEPEGSVLTLPAGTIFPTVHIRRLIQAAERGERISTAKVFDGSGLEALATATGVIGQHRAVVSEGGAVAEAPASWSISLAYHALDAGDDLPMFESVVDLREDGVLQALELDYGAFSMRGALRELELVDDAHACG